MTTLTPESRAGLRVLIVEDNPDTAASLALLLRQVGHEVRLAATGPDGLAAAHADAPDVVLLELGLPGLSGFEVARELNRGRRSNLPLLITLTGHGRREDRQRAREAGIDIFLLKPVNPRGLCALIGRFGAILHEGQIEADMPTGD
jgi:two-component system, OmpR family, response regulator